MRLKKTFKKIVWAIILIQALPRPKIAVLNLTIHQFSYREQVIHSKMHRKRSLNIKLKKSTLSHFSLSESHPKSKNGEPNLNFHQCFCSKRLFYPKWHQKGIIICCLKIIILIDFLTHALPKSKIELPNLNFNEFFCSKRQMHFQWHVKR